MLLLFWGGISLLFGSSLLGRGILFAVFLPIVMKWSLSAFAMSVALVCVLPSYFSSVGDVRGLLFEGMTVLRILACLFGSPFACSSASVSAVRFACLMAFFRYFLNRVCRWMFSCVGFCSRCA